MHTIFESMHKNKRSWGIYGHPNMMTALSFPFVRAHQSSHVHPLDRFFADSASGDLPEYSWIVPELWHQSQHPCPPKHGAPDGMVNGDNLIADVYEAIRQNDELWESTLLVITYDEGGGYPDSVVCTEEFPRIVSFDKRESETRPPQGVSGAAPTTNEDATIASEWPDGYPEDHKNADFDFRYLGVRVPALLVSAYLPSGRLDHTTYEHSSIAASLKHIFDLDSGVRPDGFLTSRDAHSPSWLSNGLFDFGSAPRRDDAPMRLPRSDALNSRM